MAEKAPADSAVEAPKPKKRGKLPLIIGLILILLLNGLVLGKIFLGGKGSHKKAHVKTAAGEEAAEEEEELGAKVQLEEFLLNLSGGDGHYLKMVMALGVKKGVTEEKVKEENAPIRDAIISVACSKKLSELSSEAGRDKLKHEMVDRINKVLKDKPVRKVYFTEFATQ